jgi:lipoate-protein ligase B
MTTPSTSTNRSAEKKRLRFPRVEDWGRTEYKQALARQHEVLARRLEGAVPDTLALTEHEPVITLGRGARLENLLLPKCPVVPVERGGDVTWHGPGQVVGYAFRLLMPGRRDLLGHLRGLEAVVMEALGVFGIEGVRAPGGTGVWVASPAGMRKIASIGIAARHWCTYHGFALNVDCDLGAFRAINPCGFDASVMTSMRDVLGASVALDAVKDALRAVASSDEARPSFR